MATATPATRDHAQDNQTLHTLIALAHRLSDTPGNDAKKSLERTLARIEQVSQRLEPIDKPEG